MNPPTPGGACGYKSDIDRVSFSDQITTDSSEELEGVLLLRTHYSLAGIVTDPSNPFQLPSNSEVLNTAGDPGRDQQTNTNEMDTLKSLRSQVEHLRSRLRSREDEFNQRLQRNEDLILKLRSTVKHRGHHIHFLEDNINSMKAALANRNNKIASQKLCIRELEQKVESFAQDFGIMQESYQKLQDDLRVAQEGALRSIKRASWVPSEDGAVRNEFSKLEENLKSWAKYYAVPDINYLEALSNEEKVEITDFLKEHISRPNFDALLGTLSPLLKKRFPLLITHAMLATYIFKIVFHNPFFALEYLNTSSNAVPKAAMFELYNAMIKVLPSEAHIWRSQMLRLLLTTPASPSELPLLTPQALQMFSSTMAEKFLRGPVRLLLKIDQSSAQQGNCMLQDLCHVFSAAAELSLSLWCQRTTMGCRLITLSKPKQFSQKCQLMVAHRLHHLDEDDSRLDGKEVLAIIQPAVVAFGNENAENYDKGKVWSRAIVLVDEGN
ncbi:hypothetical protein MGYG_04015 [Nannizzia gypsea CBS 118893]|uniref:Uncharacterized protein n=1 Tax=Arthroderma gypseum (strain ATCC MYA-4604 / CBS 118893) TaxID=535722 RepID=E4UUP6_ARTGP|nr:hypothetical protein MGYG_04015 [Nannizzia gypsea CBS 118893]EFR01013.1 hypothetical protein MGYG_04015 [Nannizzia gypsea CBS 118893]